MEYKARPIQTKVFYIVLTSLAVGWMTLLFYTSSTQSKADEAKWQYECNRFDSAEINSVIKYINRESGQGELFSVANIPDEEFFALICLFEPYANREFKRFAYIGDSVIKPQFSDTLILIKNGIRYYCRFAKCSDRYKKVNPK